MESRNTYHIHGIQQIGIGVTDVKEAYQFYKDIFSMNIKMFEDESTAELMLPYTGGKPRARHAILSINLQGGSGFEVWQYKERTPQPPAFEIKLGDLGIFAAKIKCKNMETTYTYMQEKKVNIVSKVLSDPAGEQHFFIRDPYGNYFQLIHGFQWFRLDKNPTGGPNGVIIGVSNMDKSIAFYHDLLGYDKIEYDKTGVFADFKSLPGGHGKFRRVLMTHENPRLGKFSKLFGYSSIELVQALDRQPQKIFQDRYWGDLGFIHLCFDISGMEALKEKCQQAGFPFTVDSSSSFDMGEAAGHFSYIEDPDGTLIEFVETHKIPILKKLGWYLNLTRRDPEKNLPDWVLKALRFTRDRNKRR